MYEGKTQLTRIWVVKPEFVNNWNEITEVHTKWMAETHYREGNKKLHFLNWSTAPEIKDDKETGLSHLAHAMCCLLFKLEDELLIDKEQTENKK